MPEGHLARFVCDLVDEALDLSAIYACYEEERGFAPYDPRLMVIHEGAGRVKWG